MAGLSKTISTIVSPITSLFGAQPAPAATPAPAVAPPVPMPDPKGTKEAKKRSITEMLSRRGRASTILTDPASSDALGG